MTEKSLFAGFGGQGARKWHGKAVWMNKSTRRRPQKNYKDEKSGFALANPGGAVK
jgi:hypothetical protein